MILRFLRLFAAFRALEVRAAELDGMVDLARERSAAWQARYETARESVDDYKVRLTAAEARIADLTDRISNAGDSINLSTRGRRLFSKAPVEQMPAQQGPPINLSRGSGKQLARDRVHEATREFFETLNKQVNQPETAS